MAGCEWAPGRHSLAEYERRRDECTRQQLNSLLASAAFQQWGAQRSGGDHAGAGAAAGPRKIFVKTALLALAVLACCLLLAAAAQPGGWRGRPGAAASHNHTSCTWG